MVGAVDKHLALIGFMGAGKSMFAGEVAARLGREAHDVDGAVVNAIGNDIPTFFREEGEAAFRKVEEEETLWALGLDDPAVLALGGGAVTSEKIRDGLRDRAVTVWLDVDVETCWARVRGSDRPLAQDESEFKRLYEQRRELYAEVADVATQDVDDVVLAAGGVVLGGVFENEGGLEIVADEGVLELHSPPFDAPRHVVPRGESAKTTGIAEHLWRELRLDRSGAIVAFGGGSTTDLAGFVAATYMRGIDWIAVPTTLVGQVDAAIGGKTAIDLPEGKNLVGAFHWPVRTIIDTTYLSTLPTEERRAGMAEVVKTGLLANEPFWELSENELVRRSAAFKVAICIRDRYDRGERRVLNLGHTFAHALEAGSGYGLRHGDAVALGLLAALRLSGKPADAVEEVLAPAPVRVDPDRAWESLLRDKKGRLRLVLLGDDGGFVSEVPEADVRRALDELIAD